MAAVTFEDQYADDIVSATSDAVSDAALSDAGSAVDVVSGGAAARKARRSPKDAQTTKTYYNIVRVVGACMPSASAKYCGSSPAIAAAKAGRRIWKKSHKSDFSILMRKVSKQAAGRDLYKYSVAIVKRDNPTAFVTAVAPTFRDADGKTKRDVSKRIRVVPESCDPVYGYIEDGVVVKGREGSGGNVVHRKKGTNTLTVAVNTKSIPKTVGGVPVIKNDHDVKVAREKPTESERTGLDVAGKSKGKVPKTTVKKRKPRTTKK